MFTVSVRSGAGPLRRSGIRPGVPALLAAALLAVALPAAAQLVPVGGPFALDAKPHGFGTRVHLAAHPGGGYLAVWGEFELGELLLRGRRFGPAGPIGPQLDFGVGALHQMAVATDGSLLLAGGGTVRRHGVDGALLGQPVTYDDAPVEPGAVACRGSAYHEAAVAPAAGGGFAVAWPLCLRFDGQPDDRAALRLRRFDGAGQPLGPSVRLGLAYRFGGVRLAVDGTGGWLLTAVRENAPWSDFADGFRLAVAADGSVRALSEPTRVWELRAAAGAGGSSLTVFTQSGWDYRSDDGDCTGVFGLPADGAGDLPGGAVGLPRISTDCQSDVRVVGVGDGFVAAWRTDRAWLPRPPRNPFHGISLRRFDGEGRAVGDPLDVRFAALTVDPELVVLEGLATAPDGRVGVVARVAGRVVAFIAAPVPPGPCVPGAGHLCLGGDAGDRFRADAAFVNPYAGDRPGLARAAPLTADTGALWFFAPGNLELLVKVLDGRRANGRFWVLAGAATTVEWWLTVTDTATGEQWGRGVPPYLLATVADTTAFPRPPAGHDPAAAAPHPPGLPATGEEVLLDGRYRLRVAWRNPRTGAAGVGRGATVARHGALFSFFAPSNLELLVKVLDGRAVNGHAWVLWASTTDVGFELEVEDTVTAITRRYRNEPFHLGGGADTRAFP